MGREGGGRGESEKQQREYHGQRRKRRRRRKCSMEEEIILAASEEPTPEQIFPKNPYWKRGKVCGGRSVREKLLWTDCNSHSPPLALLRGRRGRVVVSEGVRLSLGKGEEQC